MNFKISSVLRLDDSGAPIEFALLSSTAPVNPTGPTGRDRMIKSFQKEGVKRQAAELYGATCVSQDLAKHNEPLMTLAAEVSNKPVLKGRDRLVAALAKENERTKR